MQTTHGSRMTTVREASYHGQMLELCLCHTQHLQLIIPHPKCYLLGLNSVSLMVLTPWCPRDGVPTLLQSTRLLETRVFPSCSIPRLGCPHHINRLPRRFCPCLDSDCLPRGAGSAACRVYSLVIVTFT